MKPQYWAPVLAFLVVSIPVVLVLGLLQIGGDFRVWIAIAAGAVAATVTQSRLKTRGNQE